MLGSWNVAGPSRVMVPLVGPDWGNWTGAPIATVAALSPGMRAKNSAKSEDPTGPVDPVVPVGPVEPAVPVAPMLPVAPVDPGVPAGPVEPVDPLAPVAPCDPARPLDE